MAAAAATATEHLVDPTAKTLAPSAFNLDEPTRSRTRTRSKKEAAAETPAKSKRDPGVRHDRLLARNRVAASKCRQRKKQWTEKLETKKSDLQSEHADLQSQYVNLLQEASQLKDMLLNHAGCNDPNIASWIDNEAGKYAKKLAANAQGINPPDGYTGRFSRNTRMENANFAGPLTRLPSTETDPSTSESPVLLGESPDMNNAGIMFPDMIDGRF